jgi:hypothetical protein
MILLSRFPLRMVIFLAALIANLRISDTHRLTCIKIGPPSDPQYRLNY